MGKKTLLLLFLSFALNQAFAQFTSGTVNLGSNGMTVKLETSPTTVTITLVGNSNSYMGIGFGTSGMANGADGFIYNSTSNRDYTFKGVGVTPAADAVQDWTETSNTTSGSIRTVVATRSLAGGSGDTRISNAAGTISIFYARGSSTSLAYHAERGYATLKMTSSPLNGIAETSSGKDEIALSPNPAVDELSISSAEKIVSAAIYSASGTMLRKIDGNFDLVNVSDLRSGVYFIEALLGNGKTSSAKLIKK